MELSPKTISALKFLTKLFTEKNIPYQITGGFAAKIYGSKRSLNDIDVDIPEDRFKDTLSIVKPYITYGPDYFEDGKWYTYLITINYEGQEIDIGGAYETKITNQARTEWINYPIDFSKSKMIEVEGIELDVIDPQSLIDYKKHLDGEHQIEDINAIKNYIINNN